MIASGSLKYQADVFGMRVSKSFDGDYDLRVGAATASDLIQLVATLQEHGFELSFHRDNSVHVHAPHRNDHEWGDRGWNCEMGLTVAGCEAFRKLMAIRREV